MNLFKIFHGDPLELAVLLGSYYGLRRSEIVGLKWEAIDFVQKTITIRHTVTQAMVDGKYKMIYKDRPKSKKSLRTLPLLGPFEAILSKLWKLQAENQKLCSSSYCMDYLDYIYVDHMGVLIKPNYITQHFQIVLRKNGLKSVRFHDLRHPYVKHTTKKYNSEKQKTQATKMDLIAWVFRFCIFNYSKRSWIL
ncbi:MAG: tyrosine-type recombinase/integrase [Eisenbergiella porci]|nr:tyrosine-type recombinase/integrase [Eisenbergiella porci]MDY2654513.1 tyrosine-type recombinase/integrase [Eisenbergiella porci]